MDTRKQLIKNALSWLDDHELKWMLDEPIDREAFIEALLEKSGLEIKNREVT